MNQRPFRRRLWPRKVERSDLPSDLVQFFRWHEGVGLESSPDRLLRLCKLAEIEQFGWEDIPIFGREPLHGWESLQAFRIGNSSYYDEILYVINCPCCAAGAILAIGTDIYGPGGTGTAPFECSLVLASNFDAWIKHLRSMSWMEYGLVPGSVDRFAASKQQRLRSYYQMLNPAIPWGRMSAE